MILTIVVMVVAFATWVALGVEDEIFRDSYESARYEATSPAMTRWEDGLPTKPYIPWDGFDGASPSRQYQ